jgi:membrane-bound ClpP family serine protease
MNKRLTTHRLVLAIITTTLEELVIYAICRWLLPAYDIRLSVAALVGIMVAWGVFSIFLFVLTTLILKKQTPVSLPSMVGSRGRVTSRLSPEGLVRINGELWVARSSRDDIAVGDEVEVVGEDGLKLLVDKVGESQPIR